MTTMARRLVFLAAVSCGLCAGLDLTKAVVVTPPEPSVQDRKAVATLVEEIEKRTRVRLEVRHAMPAAGPAIVAGRTEKLRALAGAALDGLPAATNRAEGFRVKTAGRTVLVAGNDARGLLFGVGYLLRHLRMDRDGRLDVADDLEIATAPALPLRGHQLGYRPKVNSYDGFTVAMWEQYIRELALFGTNAVELIAPRSDDADESPHFPLPKLRMMAEMSRLCAEYGLDVWIWFPALDEDYTDPKTVEFALNEWLEVFRALPRIDHILVPGGDPGHTPPTTLFSLLEKQTASLRQFHPRAKMWISPQGFSTERMEEFYGLLARDPRWLHGIVYGPWVRYDIPRFLERVPKRFALRQYPDITHSLHCQFPVPEWDAAFALTLGRETANPRPLGQASIFRRYREYGEGFLTYSEGVNDDVNKFVWSALGWDPQADVEQVLREYSRVFLGERYAEEWARGLLALENNWVGPLLANAGVDRTWQMFAEMERNASPQLKLNWRFQQGLYRAYYDSFVRDRLLWETALENAAMGKLRQARMRGSAEAMEQAAAVLLRAVREPVSQDKRQRVFELAEAQYQSIRAQLSVPKYQAIAVGRGANLDTVDVPLNNRPWLLRRFAEIRKLEAEEERLAQLDAIVNRTNPGPGGFYDDLGNPSRQPHLERGEGFERDPQFRRTVLNSFAIRGSGSVTGQDFSFLEMYPAAWRDHAETLYDNPIRMRYTGLDRSARYRVRVVYGGENVTTKIRLAADGVEVHGFIQRPVPLRPLEFDVPPEATRDGELRLSFEGEPERGGSGRGMQVAEIWLEKKP